MAMPEATIYKYYSSVFFQDNIWRTGKPFHISPVTESIRKQVFCDDFLWFCFLPLYTGHIVTSYFFIMNIHQYFPRIGSVL